MRIGIAGAGYVGLSISVLLAKHHEVYLYDIDENKIKKLKENISPIQDQKIQEFLAKKKLNLIPTSNPELAFKSSSISIIATPTNYDEDKNIFDTHHVESAISEVMNHNKDSTIIIKSTIPIGFTEKIRVDTGNERIIFSPEFLREGKSLEDNLYPSRIIVGGNSDEARIFANLMLEGAEKKDVPILYTNSKEAEAIKLFSNSYLAMRIAYINELDSYSEIMNLNSKEIIEGMCLDPRIGMHYNNPSFGYGGYCLPKDTKQLKANYSDVPNAIIEAIVKSNDIRKDHIANSIIQKQPNVVGFYRLIMKSKSDNFRSSSIVSVINKIKAKNINCVIYEPQFIDADGKGFNGIEVITDLNKFKEISDLIIANRTDSLLKDVLHKTYTRDIFGTN